jgi:ABC-type sugar transport system permease subunit
MTAPSTVAQLSGPRGRGAAPHRARRSLAGFLFAVPALILFLLFAIYPGIQVFGLSLFDYSLTSPPEFVGFDNFAFLSSDPRFGEALLQTVFYAVGTYGPALVLALILAQALSTRIRGMGLVRLLYFLPLAMSWVAVSIIWRVVLHPEGMLNEVLQLDVNWLTSSASARWALVIMSIWKETGFFLILFLAGLSAIPSDVYEAARIDGAGAWRRFWHMTLPLLRPVTAVCAIMAVLRGVQSFSPQAVLTNGAFGTEVINLFVYKTAFESARMGRASAVAVLMFVVLLGIAIVQLRALRRRD